MRRERYIMGTKEVLRGFFSGSEGRYLVLGDPFHGNASLDTLVAYFNLESLPDIQGSMGQSAIFYLIVESKEPISKSIEPEVNILREKGFKIIPGENETTAPENPTPEWVDDCRVPIANEYWTTLAQELAGSGNFVTICCGTSHVGSCHKNDNSIKEPGLVGRLGDLSQGYAVVNTEDLYYTPEKDSTTWTYDPVPVLKPLDEDDTSSDENSSSDEK